MKILSLQILLLFISFSIALKAQNRYESEIFSAYQLQSNIQYGRSLTVSGSALDLMLDIYAGTGDTVKNRPLVIFIHGGGFKDGDKVSNFGTRVCGGLAKRGYIVASINYRLGTTNTLKSDYEAMVRAVQDGKAAVRYFRRFSSLYGIDSSQIFVTGSSAGSITALHMAYLRQNEIPSYVDLASLGGTLEGTSGNAGYSSLVQGVISNWGALVDYNYIKPGDAPVFCVHGLDDVTVPCDSSFADGPFHYGSIIINNYAKSLGNSTGIRLFVNTGHTLDNNSTKQDSAIKDFSAWLYSILKNATGVKDQGSDFQPESFILKQNYPNPFNPSTDISYSIPSDGMVEISIFNTLGSLVQKLNLGNQNAGVHQVTWNGCSHSGKNAPSGIYLTSVKYGSQVKVIKMVLNK
jgi:poly(3-hydroxybutyrate) depolymerase